MRIVCVCINRANYTNIYVKNKTARTKTYLKKIVRHQHSFHHNTTQSTNPGVMRPFKTAAAESLRPRSAGSSVAAVVALAAGPVSGAAVGFAPVVAAVADTDTDERFVELVDPYLSISDYCCTVHS